MQQNVLSFENILEHITCPIQSTIIKIVEIHFANMDIWFSVLFVLKFILFVINIDPNSLT